MPPAAVCDQLKRFENHHLLWKPGASSIATSFFTEGDPVTGNITEIPMSCYEIMLWAAHEAGITNQVIWAVINDLFWASAQKNRVPTKASIVGGLKNYSGNRCMRVFGTYPHKGDLVLFSTTGTNYIAHVAMATGDKYDVFTFGHDGLATTSAGGMQLPVERMTITEVLECNTGLTRVQFGTPPW